MIKDKWGQTPFSIYRLIAINMLRFALEPLELFEERKWGQTPFSTCFLGRPRAAGAAGRSPSRSISSYKRVRGYYPRQY